jgi:hypothetical protein
MQFLGLVIEIDGASKFSTTAAAAEIGLDQKLLRLSSSAWSFPLLSTFCQAPVSRVLTQHHALTVVIPNF